MALSFHDWMKQVKTDPAKMAKLDGIAREAEIARERDEDVAWEDRNSFDPINLQYELDQKAYGERIDEECRELIEGEDVEIDEMTRWAIENDCCTASAGGWQFDLGANSVRGGDNVGEMARLGGPILLKDARIIVQMAFEKADALLMWGELDSDENGAEWPLGVARNVKEAMKLLTEDGQRVDGWEML